MGTGGLTPCLRPQMGTFVALRVSPLLSGLHEKILLVRPQKRKARTEACVIAALTFPASGRPAETTCQLETSSRPAALGRYLFTLLLGPWCVCERHEMNHATLFMASMSTVMPAETLGKLVSKCRSDLLDRIIETAGKSSLVLTVQANSEKAWQRMPKNELPLLQVNGGPAGERRTVRLIR